MSFEISSTSFEVLFNNTTVGIIVVDKSETIFIANDFACKMFGYKPNSLSGKKLNVLIPIALRKIHKQHHVAYFKNPKSRTMGKTLDIFALHKNGRKFPVEISLGHYKMENKDFVIAIINDISEKIKKDKEIEKLNKKLEEKIEKRTKELNRIVKRLNQKIEKINNQDKLLKISNNFLKNLLKNAGTSIIATDTKGIIKLFNPTAEKLLGYKAREVVNKKTPAIFHDPDEINVRAELFSKELGVRINPGFDTLTAKAKRNIIENEEWTHIRKDKSCFPVSLTVSALHDEANNINGYLGIAIDISERNKMMEDLNNALENEKKLGELKSRFVSVASHEFRTPLSTILSSIYLLSKYTTTEEQPKREKHIKRIEESIQFLNDILNEFLTIGKLEDGDQKVNWAQLDLASEIKGIINDIKGIIKVDQKINFKHLGQKNVILDPSLFKHIVLNLLSNAIKFSPENVPIEITTEVNTEQILFSIKDYGIGIPEEDQKFLFKRFFRASNAEHIKGTGLGLYIVAKHCQLLDGSISLNSELNKGTKFVVTFNRKKK